MAEIRVALLAHDLTHHEVRGLQRYTAGLAAALARVPEIRLFLFSRQPVLPAFDSIHAERIAWPGRREILWEQYDLPAVARRASIDVLHAPSNRGLPLLPGCAAVLTRHDAIERLRPPDFPRTIRSAIRERYADWTSMRAADAVVTVSETSRRDIAAVWPAVTNRLWTLGEGIDDSFFEAESAAAQDETRRRCGVTGRYVFYAGGFEARKDVLTLVNAFAQLAMPDVSLVLAGDHRGVSSELREAVARLTPSGAIRMLGRISNDELRSFYRGAACFVYPSLYEGFGLQAVEAMACETPVIAADGGSLPEIVGTAGIIFRAGQPNDLARCLGELLTSQDLARRLASLGHSRASTFRWTTIVNRYVGLYAGLIAH